MNSLYRCFALVFAVSILARVECNSTDALSNDTFIWSESEQVPLKIYPEQRPLYYPALVSFALLCKGTSNNDDDLTNMEWRDPKGNVIQEGSTTVHGGTKKLDKTTLKLIILRPQVGDSGEYSCSALHMNNETVKTSVTVTFYDDIVFEDCREEQSLILGEQGEIRCRVAGNPKPVVVWSKDDVIVTSDSECIILPDKLMIPVVKQTDQGTYAVEAYVRSTGQMKFKKIRVEVRNVTTPTCPVFQFECDNGRCISQSRVCDGYNDCGDWSDERNCATPPEPYRTTASPCSYWQFRCNNGRCVNRDNVCNGYNDCGDWSDELNCISTNRPTTQRCSSLEFQCRNGRCILSRYVCDGDNDCGDWSDEAFCPTTRRPACSSNMFTCRNQRCIRTRYVCDGENNCGDWSDESDCLSVTRSSRTVTRTPIIVGIVIAVAVLIIIFIVAVWIVKVRRSRAKTGTAFNPQPPAVSNQVQHLPESGTQASQPPHAPQQPHVPQPPHAPQPSHAPQPTTQNTGIPDHALAQGFHLASTSPRVVQQHGNLHPTVGHNMQADHNVHPGHNIQLSRNMQHSSQQDIHQQQSNLYPTLPQQLYPSAPESASP